MSKFKKRKPTIQKYTKVPSLYLGSVFELVMTAFENVNREVRTALKQSVNYENMPCEYYIVKDTHKGVSITESFGSIKFTVSTGTLSYMLSSLRRTLCESNRELMYNWRHLTDQCDNNHYDTVTWNYNFDQLSLDDDDCEDRLKLSYAFRRPYVREAVASASILLDVLHFMNEGNHTCLGGVSKQKFWNVYRLLSRDYASKSLPRITTTISQRLEPSKLMRELLDLECEFHKPDWLNNPDFKLWTDRWHSESEDLYTHTHVINSTDNLLTKLRSWKTVAKTVNLIDEARISNLMGVQI